MYNLERNQIKIKAFEKEEANHYIDVIQNAFEPVAKAFRYD